MKIGMKRAAIALMLSGLKMAFAGTWEVKQDGACLEAVATGEPFVHHYTDASNADSKFLVGITTDGTYPNIGGTPSMCFRVTWTPSYSGETRPQFAYGTFQMAGNIFGPSGSSGSIVASDNTTLLNSLGVDGTYSNLYTFVVGTSLRKLDDGTVVGSFDIPLDALSSSGGSTVRERASFISVSDSLVLNSEQTKRIVRKKTFGNGVITCFLQPKPRFAKS